MKELIKIQQKNGVTGCNARNVYDYLESKQEFANWIKGRIDKYGFEEKKDFLIILSKSTGGRPSVEYFVTNDMAKELGMIENNERGRELRRYFIAVEKEAMGTKLPAVPKSFAEALELAARQQRELEVKAVQLELAESTIKESAPKVKYHDEVLQAANGITTTIIAKDLGMSATSLNKILCERKVIYKSQGTWVLYQRYVNRGYTITQTFPHLASDGLTTITEIHTYWTEAGRKFIMDGIAKIGAKDLSLKFR